MTKKSCSDSEKSPRCIRQRYVAKQARERMTHKIHISFQLKTKGLRGSWARELGRHSHNVLDTYMKFSKNKNIIFKKWSVREKYV